MNSVPHKRTAPHVCLTIILLLCVPVFGYSQEPPVPDVRLVVDISGSMKKNDPANLRQPAVELLVQLLPKGSQSGVWTFGQYVNELVPHQTVDEAWKDKAISQSAAINSVGLFTNIGLALEKAGLDDTATDSTSVILLTDGMVDIAKDPAVNKREWRRIADEVLPKLQAAGVRVHTIALSDNADSQLLNKLALATNGKAATAKTADELMKAFLDTFDQAAPAEQLPLTGDTFVVDASVEEFTALIFRKDKMSPTVLADPAGNQYQAAEADRKPNVSWHSGLDYDLITLKEPLAGEWEVVSGIAPDSRVTIVSNLNFWVKTLPSNLFRGQRMPINARLQQDGETVTDPDFLQLLDISVTTLGADQRQVANLGEQGIPPNGVYRTRLAHFNQAGEYELTVALDGKSFQRQIRQSVTVRDAFSVEFGPGVQPGMPHELSVTPFIQTIDFKKSGVIALIKTPSGQTSILPVPATQVDDWLLKYSPKADGLYEVSLTINVVETNGTEYEYKHPTFQFSYPEGEVVKPEEPAAPEPEPEAEPEPEEATEPEAEPEKKGIAWWIYVLLGLANVLIFGLAFMAYRMVMGGKKDSSSEEKPAKESKKKGKKKDKKKEPEKPEEEPEGVVAEAEPEPEPEALDEALAMADIDDDEPPAEDATVTSEEPPAEDAQASEPEEDDLLAEAMDLSTDEPEAIAEESLGEATEETTTDEPEEELASEVIEPEEDLTEPEEPTASTEEEIPEAPMDDLEAMLASATADLPDIEDGGDEFALDDFDSDKK